MRFINRVLDLIVIVICAFLVIDVFWQVITRYMTRTPAAWTVEVAQILFSWLCLLGFAIVLRERGHYDVDVIVKALPHRVQKYFTLVNNLLVLIFLIVLFIAGIKFSIMGKERISPVLQIYEHWIYIIIPVACLLIVFYLVIEIVKSFQDSPERTLGSIDHEKDQND